MTQKIARLAAFSTYVKQIIESSGQKPIRLQVGNKILQDFNMFTNEVIEAYPDLYQGISFDMSHIDPVDFQISGLAYRKVDIAQLSSVLEMIIEIWTNFHSSFSSKVASLPNPKIFISHGRSQDWRELQAYLEKDLEIDTMELEQEPNRGMTIIQKFEEAASKCNYAVIIMTGDDVMGDVIRARQNVIHEYGFFQGRYGLTNVALLLESGVELFSNMSGIVYIEFPRGGIRSALPLLYRELKTIFLGQL